MMYYDDYGLLRFKDMLLTKFNFPSDSIENMFERLDRPYEEGAVLHCMECNEVIKEEAYMNCAYEDHYCEDCIVNIARDVQYAAVAMAEERCVVYSLPENLLFEDWSTKFKAGRHRYSNYEKLLAEYCEPFDPWHTIYYHAIKSRIAELLWEKFEELEDTWLERSEETCDAESHEDSQR